MLIQGHVNSLLSLPVVSNNSYVSLRQLTDTFHSGFESLRRLKVPVDAWDPILIPVIVGKLDFPTRREWESSIKTNEVPTIQEFKEFLIRRCRFLENLHIHRPLDKLQATTALKSSAKGATRSVNLAVKAQCCPMCKESHFLYACAALQKLSVMQRIEKIKSLKLCTNCLRENHKTSQCRSSLCKICQKRHHTMLHYEEARTENADRTVEPPLGGAVSIAGHSYQPQLGAQILLSTFIVDVFDVNNRLHECRGLLDVGSQSNFISQNMCQKLGLKSKPTHLPIAGINGVVSAVTKLFVLPRITESLPLRSFTVTNIQIPENLQLADPHFYLSKPIDLLLGAELFWDLLCVGQVRATKDQPSFHKTLLGWVAGGVIDDRRPRQSTVCAHSLQALEQQVSNFWEIEELSEKVKPSDVDKCESYFSNTTTRDAFGRFCVHLPFRAVFTYLGSSRELATKRFYSLERKLQKNPELNKQYYSFMQEYLNLGHMEPVEVSQLSKNTNVFYLPHHAILRENSLTIKLRVVFDGSFKGNKNLSLNDVLLSGPPLQQELFCILLRFRVHAYPICADIKQMYRQIKLAPEHRDFHRILWRPHPKEELQTYRLTTVTYGVTSAPYLAIRCLHELARIEGGEYPEASAAMLKDFYVDDLITGSDDLNETVMLAKRIRSILSKGKFELHKWASNDSRILSALREGQAEPCKVNLDKQSSKILGVCWNQTKDTLTYSIERRDLTRKVTKRIILSTLAQFFDPLGLIAPVIVLAKILLQKLWVLKLAWDETVPQIIHEKWMHLLDHVSELDSLSIPRHVYVAACEVVEIHAFCDASESAYGSCIYIKSANGAGDFLVNLFCAKSRVAPVKTITLPRLELCGAVLLARLLDKILKNTNIKVDKVYCWTDSMIVLTWISSPSNSWKTFVSHRVAEIQDLTLVENWHHVRSEQNPADLVSRGCLPQRLVGSGLWWNGPDWLSRSSDHYPLNSITKVKNTELLERRPICLVANHVQQCELLYKFSKFVKLQRVMAFCLRFVYNTRNSTCKSTGVLKTEELKQASIRIVKLVQAEAFSSEIRTLEKGEFVSSSSKLVSLNPFLDSAGILRVGGRLTAANLSREGKHPAVLPAGHGVTKLIIENEHIRQLHAGTSLTLASVRQQFWPLNGRSVVRGVLRKCIKCFRAKPPETNQMMGNLPIDRVVPGRPFLKTGVDYGGPVVIKDGKGRGRKTIKSYIVLFICLVTKAIHLEVVCDCTSESFLYALKRFISRRGRPSDIFSDNGTTFVGANRELRVLKELFETDQFRKAVVEKLPSDGIQWHFIPPHAPHFGGIWEVGIKSVKYHMRRIIGNALLTLDEFYSTLTQIEACLNSRPITVLSNDPNDPVALTPGHFLIGSPLTSIPEPELTSLKEQTLSRWQRGQQLVQHFWKRWSKEYLTQLHQRSKWPQPKAWDSMQGRVVVVRGNNTPPLCWKLARIVDTHPGKDQLIRVVSLKTKDGIIKRPVTKISLLPVVDQIDFDG